MNDLGYITSYGSKQGISKHIAGNGTLSVNAIANNTSALKGPPTLFTHHSFSNSAASSFFLELCRVIQSHLSSPPPHLLPRRTSISNVSPQLMGDGGCLRTKAFEEECVHFFEEIVQIFGMPKSVGLIYGVLYASLEPLSFSDIVERLHISKGSASQGLQLLRSLGAINEAASTVATDRKTMATGDGRRTARNLAYEPELSLRRLVNGVLRERIAPLAACGETRLSRLRHLAEKSPEHTKFYLGRTKQLETWRKRLAAVLPILTALLGSKKKK